MRRLPTAVPPLAAAVADATGQVEFANLPAGTAWVVATRDAPGSNPALLTATEKVQLIPGQSVSVVLTLS